MTRLAAMGVLRNVAAAVGGVVLFLCAAVGALIQMDRQRPPSVRAEELSYLPKGEYLRVAVLGYQQVVADLIWVKAVYHFGERNPTKGAYSWAYHVVDVVTDLDPNFSFAYEAGGINLGVWGGLLHESIAILSKGYRYGLSEGLAHYPSAWRNLWHLPFYIGYDYYYELCDPAKAAPFFQQASKLPGSPEYLAKLAARMTVEGGDPDAALEFLQRFYQQTQEARLREALADKIKQIVVERDIRFLEEGVRRYRAHYGKRPKALRDLVRGQIIGRIPEEPFGGRYELDADGSVIDTALPERLRVHRAPAVQGCQRREAVPYVPR
jgi:tetratricopeptide (TPR) repeat protein